MKKLIYILFLFLVACKPKVGDKIKQPAGEGPIFYGGSAFDTIRLECQPTCPSVELVESRLTSIYEIYKPYLETPYKKPTAEAFWKTASPVFLIRFSNVYYDHPTLQEKNIRGMYIPDSAAVWVYYPHPCGGTCPQGLCAGIFDYEIGHAFQIVYLDRMKTERENLEFRKDNDLLMSQEAKQCSQKPANDSP